MERRSESPRGWRQWTETEARAALAELAQSGQSVGEFTRARGYSTQRIRYWKKRLGGGDSVAAFLPVRLPVAVVGTAAIEIISGGITVRLREDLDVEHIARLVEALANRAG